MYRIFLYSLASSLLLNRVGMACDQANTLSPRENFSPCTKQHAIAILCISKKIGKKMKYDTHSTNTTVTRYGRKAASLITVVLLFCAQVAEVAGNIVFIHHLLLLFREMWRGCWVLSFFSLSAQRSGDSNSLNKQTL